MIFKRLDIHDLILIEPTLFSDKRGYFYEKFKLKSLQQYVKYKLDFVQENESRSNYGVVRGLHYQNAPREQSKLVSVSSGEILDVAVDIRDSSATYGKHISVILSEKNRKQLFIPKGFAHGFVVLSDFAVVNYKVDNYYSKIHEDSIIYNDLKLNIDWKIPNNMIILSKKDKLAKNFE